MSGGRPRWVDEFARHLQMKTWFWLYGNIRDVVPYGQTRLWLEDFLDRYLRDVGYDLVARYDLVDGFQFRSDEDRAAFHAADPSRDNMAGRKDREQTDEAFASIRRVLASRAHRTAVVVNRPELLEEGDSAGAYPRALLQLAKSARTAALHPTDRGPLYNLTVLVSDRLEDIPHWARQSDPLCKTVHIGLPDEEERREYFATRLGDLHGGERVAAPDRAALLYANLTHGMMYRDLGSLIQLSRDLNLPAEEPRVLVDVFRFGKVESPWRSDSLRERLADAEATLGRRVLGQPMAVRHVSDILKRAAEGLSGAQFSGHEHRPKGTLFFAGPSGVGKTELAKATAELLFGDERRCLRFDMSEYSQPHSDQRLFGAPPGYVGHSDGGQLTNQVRDNPFSVLLFDEIEKAHPEILDKFLQVLDDGRLTSGRGETVYFTECLIIFTSNKGLYRETYDDGAVRRLPMVQPTCRHCTACGEHFFDLRLGDCPSCGTQGMEEVQTPYGRLREHATAEIKAYLRPEILNRIGQNIIVFDFIRPKVLRQIVVGMLETVRRDLKRRRDIDVDFEPVQDWICAQASQDLELGGRGIGNTIESVLINPLARHLFDSGTQNASRLTVLGIDEETVGDEKGYRVRVEARPR